MTADFHFENAGPRASEAEHLTVRVVEALEQGETGRADELFRAVVDCFGDPAEGWYRLGTWLLGAGRSEAVECLETALRLRPGDRAARFQLALACRAAHRVDDAVTHLQAVVSQSRAPDPVLGAAGKLFREMGRISEARDCYRRAAAGDAPDGRTLSNLGLCEKLLGNVPAAEAAFRAAFSRQPDLAEAHSNLSAVLVETGRITEALAHCDAALRLRPGFAGALNNRARACQYGGRIRESREGYAAAVAAAPSDPAIAANLAYAHCYGDDLSPAAVADAHRRWANRFARPSSGGYPPVRRSPIGRRLRIGYVSPDLRQHPVGTFLAPVIAHHDKTRFRIFCFSDTRQPDAVTQRLRAAADDWHDTAGLDNSALFDRIQACEIDVLVDLAGHTEGNRLPIFAKRAAPVQVSWLGYPATTGLSAMDYRITDPLADPPGQTEAFHTETLVRLAPPFLCFAPPAEAPAVAEPPVMSAGRITFGSFNNLAKVNPTVIACWARLLQRVPTARLFLKFKSFADPGVRAHLLSGFAAHGIAEDRIQLTGFAPTPEAHLAAYHRVDIALDTFPYNGTTTTCEALFMGVPVVALAGSAHAGRVGVSLLTSVGLGGLVAADIGAYIDIAAMLAGDRDRLARLRDGLRRQMTGSALCDANGFTRRLEAAFAAMTGTGTATAASVHGFRMDSENS